MQIFLTSRRNQLISPLCSISSTTAWLMKKQRAPSTILSTSYKSKTFTMKKIIIILTVILLLFGTIGFVLARNKKAIDVQKVVVDRSNIPVAVAVTKVSLQTMDGGLQLPATLQPSKQ